MTCKRHGVKSPDGWMEFCLPDGDTIRCDTIQCVHCGMHWQHNPGSGKVRGLCGKCKGPICGPDCAECVPFERWLEIVEGTENPTAVHSSTAGMALSAGGIWAPGDK